MAEEKKKGFNPLGLPERPPLLKEEGERLQQEAEQFQKTQQQETVLKGVQFAADIDEWGPDLLTNAFKGLLNTGLETINTVIDLENLKEDAVLKGMNVLHSEINHSFGGVYPETPLLPTSTHKHDLPTIPPVPYHPIYNSQTAGEVVGSISQFLGGFIPFAGWATRGGLLGRVGKLSVVEGGVSAVAFDEQKASFNALLETAGVDPTIRNVLAAQPDDPAVLGKLKNAFGNSLLGVPVNAAMEAALVPLVAVTYKYFKGVDDLVKEGLPIEEALQQPEIVKIALEMEDGAFSLASLGSQKPTGGLHFSPASFSPDGTPTPPKGFQALNPEEEKLAEQIANSWVKNQESLSRTGTLNENIATYQDALGNEIPAYNYLAASQKPEMRAAIYQSLRKHYDNLGYSKKEIADLITQKLAASGKELDYLSDGMVNRLEVDDLVNVEIVELLAEMADDDLVATFSKFTQATDEGSTTAIRQELAEKILAAMEYYDASKANRSFFGNLGNILQRNNGSKVPKQKINVDPLKPKDAPTATPKTDDVPEPTATPKTTDAPEQAADSAGTKTDKDKKVLRKTNEVVELEEGEKILRSGNEIVTPEADEKILTRGAELVTPGEGEKIVPPGGQVIDAEGKKIARKGNQIIDENQKGIGSDRIVVDAKADTFSKLLANMSTKEIKELGILIKQLRSINPNAARLTIRSLVETGSLAPSKGFSKRAYNLVISTINELATQNLLTSLRTGLIGLPSWPLLTLPRAGMRWSYALMRAMRPELRRGADGNVDITFNKDFVLIEAARSRYVTSLWLPQWLTSLKQKALNQAPTEKVLNPYKNAQKAFQLESGQYLGGREGGVMGEGNNLRAFSGGRDVALGKAPRGMDLADPKNPLYFMDPKQWEALSGQEQLSLLGYSRGAAKSLFLGTAGFVGRAPSRLMGTIDEFQKTISGGGALYAALTSEGLEKGLKGKQLKQFVDHHMNKMIIDGKMQTEHRIVQSIQDDVREITAQQGLTKKEQKRLLLEKLAAAQDDLDNGRRAQLEFAEEEAREGVLQTQYPRMSPDGLFGSKKQIDKFLSAPVATAIRAVGESREFLPTSVIATFMNSPYNTVANFFDRLPASFIQEGVERARLGADYLNGTHAESKAFWSRHMNDLRSGDPTRVARARSTQLEGMALFAMAQQLWERGTVTGGNHPDPNMRYKILFELGEGKVLTFDYRKFPPLNYILATTTDVNETIAMESNIVGRESDHFKILSAAFVSMMRVTADLPTLTMLGDFFEAMFTDKTQQGAEKAEKLFTKTIVNAVNTLVPGASLLKDQDKVEQMDEGKPSVRGMSPMQALKVQTHRIKPWTDSGYTGNKVRDWLGRPSQSRPVPDGSDLLNRMLIQFNPVPIGVVNPSPIDEEYTRIVRETRMAWRTLPPYVKKRKKDVAGEGFDLGRDLNPKTGQSAWDAWQELTSSITLGTNSLTLQERIEREIKSGLYQKKSNQEKKERIQKHITRYRNAAFDKLVISNKYPNVTRYWQEDYDGSSNFGELLQKELNKKLQKIEDLRDFDASQILLEKFLKK